MGPLGTDTAIGCHSDAYVCMSLYLEYTCMFPDYKDDFYDPVGTLGKRLENVAREAVTFIALDRNPRENISYWSPPDRPVNVFLHLGKLTEFFCRTAKHQGSQVNETKLWDFRACVHRWCDGDRTPEARRSAIESFSIASRELSGLGFP
jgi:hypothetical protein